MDFGDGPQKDHLTFGHRTLGVGLCEPWEFHTHLLREQMIDDPAPMTATLDTVFTSYANQIDKVEL
jgi:hypothetical protein